MGAEKYYNVAHLTQFCSKIPHRTKCGRRAGAVLVDVVYGSPPKATNRNISPDEEEMIERICNELRQDSKEDFDISNFSAGRHLHLCVNSQLLGMAFFQNKCDLKCC